MNLHHIKYLILLTVIFLVNNIEASSKVDKEVWFPRVLLTPSEAVKISNKYAKMQCEKDLEDYYVRSIHLAYIVGGEESIIAYPEWHIRYERKGVKNENGEKVYMFGGNFSVSISNDQKPLIECNSG